MSAPGARARNRLAWMALVLVVGAALGVGAWRGSGVPTAAQRASAIDAALRCPSCEGVSVLDSSAATAVAIRHDVAARVRSGQSEAQIEQFLTSKYGPGILLRPPLRGATAWVWVLPLIALAAGLTGVVVVVARRRGLGRASLSEEDRKLVASALAATDGRAGNGAW